MSFRFSEVKIPDLRNDGMTSHGNSSGSSGPAGVFNFGLNLYGFQNSVGLAGTQAVQYFSARGVKSYRLPIQPWTIAQPSNNAALDVNFLTALSNVLGVIKANGSRALIDLHNFGRTPAGGILGTPGAPISILLNFWQQMSDFCLADPSGGIADFDIMNEWYGMDPNSSLPSTDYSQATILECNRQVMNTVRANGDNRWLYHEWDHYSSAWDSVPNNISLLMDLVKTDPAKKSKVSVHMYPDSDDSGSNFNWDNEVAKSGSAPPGLNTSVDIGAQRMQDVITLANQKGVPLHLGETGWSSDLIQIGGSDKPEQWNQCALNTFNLCRDNGVEVHAWAGGPGFNAGYPYNPSPTSVSNYNLNDFSTAGLQSTHMTVIEEFTGYTEPSVPLGYRAELPFGVTPYTPNGTPLGGLKIRHNAQNHGVETFTGHAAYPDGTNAGGTFSTIQIPAGDNGIAVFSYTPAVAAAAINLTFTNGAGLNNPPAIGISSAADFFITFGEIGHNIYSVRRLVSFYVGAAFSLQRSDGVQLDFFFNNRGDLPRQAIQDWAATRTISIVKWYDQSGLGNHASFSAGTLVLDLVSTTDGYPAARIVGASNSLVSTPSRGKTRTTVYADVYPTNGGDLVTSDDPNSIYRMHYNDFSVGKNNGPSAGTVALTGSAQNAWHELGGAYSSLYGTNNLKGYVDGSMVSQLTTPQFSSNGQSGVVNLFNFRFGDQHFTGNIHTIVIHYNEYTATQFSALHSDRAAYYGTSLPDTLTALPPGILGAAAKSEISGKNITPFSGVSIVDENVGATVSVTLTRTGASGGSLNGTGLSGSGPWTIASDTPANVTTVLKALIYTSTGAVASTDTIKIDVLSSTTRTATNSSTVITMIAAAAAETPFAAPSGTFSPTNMSGPNIIAAQGGYPATTNAFNYIYPRDEEIDYWASVGAGSIRVPINIRRFQPASYGSIDPIPRPDGELVNGYPPHYVAGTQTNLAEMKRVLDRCRTHNMYVFFDPHQNTILDTLSNVSRPLGGTDTEARAQMQDWWVRMCTIYKNYDNAVFELCNEPTAGTAANNQAFWAPIITAVATIVTKNQWVFCPTTFFSGANTFVSRGEDVAWTGYTPPAGIRFALVGHQYLNDANDGFTEDVVAGKGASSLVAMTNACRTLGIKCVLTETGWSPNNAQPNIGSAAPHGGVYGTPSTEGNAILAYAKANNDVWVGWSFWLGGDYVFEGDWTLTTSGSSRRSVFSAVPNGLRAHPGVPPYTDAPQVTVMQANYI